MKFYLFSFELPLMDITSDHICLGLFLDFPWIYMCLPSLVPWLPNFKNCYKASVVWFFQLYSFLKKNVLGSLVLLAININFRVNICLQKICLDLHRVCIKSRDKIGRVDWHLYCESLLWVFQSMNMVCLSNYLSILWFLS